MKFLKAINAAMGPRKYIIFTLCSGVTVAVDWLYSKIEATGKPVPLLGVPSWVVATWVGTGLIVYWLLDHLVKMRDRIKGARLELARLRTSGVDLRNHGRHLIGSKIPWKKWEKDVTDWDLNVIDCLKNVNEAAAEWFKVLDVVPSPRLQVIEFLQDQDERDAHLDLYKWHDFRLTRLEKLIWIIWREN